MDIEQFKDCAEQRNVPWNKCKLTGACLGNPDPLANRRPDQGSDAV
jgi:hypothetical protein